MSKKQDKHSATFPKKNRISLKRDFDYILSEGKRRKSKLFTLIILDNNLPFSRLGIRISKKIGNAVTRNKIKRLLRETFRHNKNKLIQKWDIIVIPHQSILHVSYKIIEQQFLDLVLNKQCKELDIK
ncbi:MAG: ribonuclease P protein component [Candidatus Fischerbacteria bacterium RBG_13_37_8]|uniref:Ribonuclease P protein component n=1 Tax=Candidatus Fischerbacteria bacterium RBG_13_37_8 TaxID=1817863 RepID=A0A1F5VKR5_9BACT|nr:MAG: ribonuclease P protein component [Candidatus Fischerbacteria bacterium RBG_13_37_8]